MQRLVGTRQKKSECLAQLPGTLKCPKNFFLLEVNHFFFFFHFLSGHFAIRVLWWQWWWWWHEKGNEFSSGHFFFFNFRDTYANLRDIFKTESTIFSLLYALSINGTTYFSFSTKTWATPHIIVIIIYYIPLWVTL